jgi:glycosyltransferase involved in cell wall biosynthesis
MTTVGVIIPTHGTNPYLASAIESVLGQVFADWALVIVCDGADPSTTGVADRFAAADRRIRVVRQLRAGVAAARNRGLDELGQRVHAIAFLDHDDRWLPSALDTLTRALDCAPRGSVGVHGLARFIDEAGLPVRAGELEADLRRRRGVADGRLVEWPIASATAFANLAFSNCIPMGTVLVGRAALEEVGRFDERAVPADDYDMWLRLARLGDFGFVDAVVMEYRQHPSPSWVRPRGLGRGAPYVRRKTVTSALNTPEQARQAREGYRLCAQQVIGDAVSRSVGLVGRRDFRAGARELLRAVLNLGGYLRGCPGPWHE